MTPSEPKSMEATDFSATPSTATTVPMPKESWTTRSPGERLGISRAGLALEAASARSAAELKLRRPASVGVPRRVEPPLRSRAAPAGLLRGRTAPVDEVDRELVEEAAGRVVAGRAPRGADEGPGDVEALLRAGETDVGEAALLLELGLVAERALVGEDAVLEAGEEDDRELEALGRVERHQRDDPGVVAVRGVGDLVGVGDQGDPLEEVAEADGDGAGLDLGRVGARPRLRVLGELAGDRDELGEVLHAGAVLRVVARLELGEVARALEHGLEDDVGALVGLDHRLQLLHHRDERLDVLQAARGQARRVGCPRQRLPEGDPVAVGEGGDAGLGPLADAALGGVEHPAQRDLVGGVDQHPEVGQRVADLLALVEAHPADDLVGLAGADEHLLEDA